MNKKIIILFLLVVFAASINSCKKDDKPVATVLVVYSDNSPVEGAIVTVYSTPNGSYIDPKTLTEDVSKETDASGRVGFTFEEECILTAKAEFENKDGIILQADGLLIIRKDEPYERKLILK